MSKYVIGRGPMKRFSLSKRELHMLVPDVVQVARTKEESIAHNDDKEPYFRELETLSREMGLDPVIHKLQMSTIESTIKQLPVDALILNLCDGCDTDGVPGPSVAVCLEQERLPNVVGCDSLFINNTLTKNGMKHIFKQNLVSTPPGFGYTQDDNLEQLIDENGMTFPLFVKVNDSYGSVGIDDQSVCHSLEQLYEKTKKLFQLFPSLTIEEFIDGPEFSVLISGNCRDQSQTVVVYPPAERRFNNNLGRFQKFISFDRNWDLSLLAHHYVPVENKDDYHALQDLARRAYIAVSGNCYGRVDIRKRDVSGKFYVLEVNAACGLGAGSSSDFILKLAGHSMQDFFKIIVLGAIDAQVDAYPLTEEPESFVQAKEQIDKLITNPSLLVVPNPVVHVITAAILEDNGETDQEGKLKFMWGKDAAYVSELETIFRNIGYDPIVHVLHVDDIELVVESLDTETDLVFNACLGSDGLFVAKMLEGRQFQRIVGLNAQFFESASQRQTMRAQLMASKVPTPRGILFSTRTKITRIQHDMKIAKIHFPVYVKPAIVSRQLDGVHSGAKLESEDDLAEYLIGEYQEWILEPFVAGTSYRLLVAGNARDPSSDIIVFPPVMEQPRTDFKPKQAPKRQYSFQIFDKQAIQGSNMSLNVMQTVDDTMLIMQLQDIARRAYVAVHGSCYALVNLLATDDDITCVSVVGDVRFGEDAKAGSVMKMAGVSVEQLFQWLIKRPVSAP
ncbi:hypothetical protein EDD86DRAFT_206360 [Gorgonomyces haynaldii]|nr:hypothetical protein EDD86DRAFT_206360 [Gorgonomyces haynaldii]